MKLFKIAIVIILVVANTIPAFAYTEIQSAPIGYLLSSTLNKVNECTTLTKTLKKGDNEDEVYKLSSFLKKEKFYKGNISTKFSSSIERALKKYQLSKGIFLSKTDLGFGETELITRNIIQLNTCTEKQEVELKKNTQKAMGYTVSTATRSGVKIIDQNSEQIFDLIVKPVDVDVNVENLTLEFVSNNYSSKPWNYIESIELIKDSKIISKKRTQSKEWSAVVGKNDTYSISLDGSSESFEQNKSHSFIVKITALRSGLDLDSVSFSASVAIDGLKMRFPNYFINNIESTAVWPKDSESQIKSEFSIGKKKSRTMIERTSRGD